jgi:hypothetical protein
MSLLSRRQTGVRIAAQLAAMGSSRSGVLLPGVRSVKSMNFGVFGELELSLISPLDATLADRFRRAGVSA